MKTLLLILAIVFSIEYVVAQTNWIVTGNSPASSGTFLGTSTAFPLELKTTNTGTPQPINFYTNNTQQATIDASGNVGIGTTSPTALLHINGGDIKVVSGNIDISTLRSSTCSAGHANEQISGMLNPEQAKSIYQAALFKKHGKNLSAF